MTEVDYLTEDEPLSKQKFVVMTILTSKFMKESEFSKFMGIKIRGSYATYEEAQKRAAYLQKIDPLFNVFIGEVGKWLPLDDDPDKAEDVTYSDKKLNNLMKAYIKNQDDAKELYNTRKNEMILKTLKESINEKPETKPETKLDEIEEENEDDKKMNELENEIKRVKELLKKDTTEEDNININKLRDICEEFNTIGDKL